MNKPLYDYFTNDHRRIEAFLDKATEVSGKIDMGYYHHFRTGLLRHIKMEEKILFPAAQRANQNIPVPLAAKLRLDHGALTALMTVPPDDEVIKVLRHVLDKHDLLEEEPGGMYDICEKLTETQTEEILKHLDAVTEVPVHPPSTFSFVLDAAKRSLARAGFDYDAILSM